MNCVHVKSLSEECLLCGTFGFDDMSDPRLIVIDLADLDGAIADLMGVNASRYEAGMAREMERSVPIERRPVESSNLASVGYDGTFNVLEVEFKTGDIYRYFGVPIDVGLGLIDAPSKGKYFHANIVQGGFKFECMFKANPPKLEADNASN